MPPGGWHPRAAMRIDFVNAYPTSKWEPPSRRHDSECAMRQEMVCVRTNAFWKIADMTISASRSRRGICLFLNVWGKILVQPAAGQVTRSRNIRESSRNIFPYASGSSAIGSASLPMILACVNLGLNYRPSLMNPARIQL